MMKIWGIAGAGRIVAGRSGTIRQVLARVVAGIVGVALMLSLTGCTLWTVRSLHPAAGAAGGASAEPGNEMGSHLPSRPISFGRPAGASNDSR